MKVRLVHLGIAVENLDDTFKVFTQALGLEGDPEEREVVKEQGVEVAFARTGNDCSLEFLQPTRDDSPVGKFIAKRGQGIHHIALQVDDLEKTLADLEAKGIPMIDKQPRQGAHGKRIAFVHPKATSGVLVELCDDRGVA